MVFDHMTPGAHRRNNVRKTAISTAMHQLPLGSAPVGRIQARAKDNSPTNGGRCCFLRMVILNQTHAVAKTAVDLVPDAASILDGTAGRRLRASADAGAGCEYASGRFSAEGLLSVNNRHLPFFPRQTLLHNHFRDQRDALIQNLTTRAV